MPKMTEEYDIFISYSHADSELAQSLNTKLAAAGLRCFMAEKDIGAAERWGHRIREAIRASKRLLFIITPNSIDSHWVVAEAGAAWVLDKDLVPALAYVDTNNLIALISSHQARRVQTPEQVNALVQELARDGSIIHGNISGLWQDPEDNDVAYFSQQGSAVVGFYDLGEDRKAGVYLGDLTERVFKYSWRLLDNKDQGKGEMALTADGQHLFGQYWYGKRKKRGLAHVGYDRVSDEMPQWISAEDFDEYWS